uniref:KEN domain-containing protein n=1 Tax=Chelonoidis abingdonii TaxID=106734 RepID=A0A8C0H5F7_CHEAB
MRISQMRKRGMLVLYVVTRGEVPFDGPDGEDVAARCPTDLQGHLEIEDLIRSLVSPHRGNSVQLEDLLHHPFFWTHESRFEFLMDVGNNPDIEKYNPESQIVKALNCNKATTEKHFYQWTKKIDQDVLENMEQRRRPYKDTVTDLLRLIRNVGAHYGMKIVLGDCEGRWVGGGPFFTSSIIKKQKTTLRAFYPLLSSTPFAVPPSQLYSNPYS